MSDPTARGSFESALLRLHAAQEALKLKHVELLVAIAQGVDNDDLLRKEVETLNETVHSALRELEAAVLSQ